RYPTALDLAADVERWLADEPVSVCPEPLSVRLGRWARRHRPLVAATAALLVTAVVTLSVGLALLRREQGHTEEALQEARRNFRQLRQTVDRYFTQVSENILLNEPGLEPLRRQLLQEALTSYQEFVQQHHGDTELELELAEAHLRLARITRLL